MRFVPIKSAPTQAAAMVLSVRETLVGQRTQLVNKLHGHAAEFGIIAGKGIARVEPLLEKIAQDESVPATARRMLAFLGQQIAHLDQRLSELDRELAAQHKANPVSQQLDKVPGLGPIAALTLALTVDAAEFRSGRHFAAWLGITPREHSTGGKPRLGKISRAGNERLRQLLVVDATAVIKAARSGGKLATPWLQALLERRPRKVAAVALANKMARIAWAMMTSGEAYRHAKPAC